MTKQRAYKFRALSNFTHVADIFNNYRFHTAHFRELNDPMEGTLFEHDKDVEQYINDMEQERDNIRICSFSREYSNVLLWAHYADEFKGICIEVELDSFPNHEIIKVFYHPPSTWLHFSNNNKDYACSWAKEVLKSKYRVWKYEAEVRILTTEEYISHPICVIKSVLLGRQMSPSMKTAILKLVPEGVQVRAGLEKLDRDISDKAALK